MNFNAVLPFYEQSRVRPEWHALVVGDTAISYGDLAALAQRISSWLRSQTGGQVARVGILASRSLEAYAGIIGTLWTGAAYVPIHPKTPDDRLIQLLRLICPDALVVDSAGLGRLRGEVAKACPRLVLAGDPPQKLKSAALSAGLPLADYHDLPDFDRSDQPSAVSERQLAYMIFTSGTTGVPKGVMVPVANIKQLTTVMQQLYEIQPDERVAQVFELAFDGSVLDMFITWNVGATLCVCPAEQLMGPVKFLKEQRLTSWNSAPSTAAFMDRMRMLTPGAFPHLRRSLFGGEALPLATALAWQAAAPNSVVDNVYGPTEATVICIAQRLTNPPKVTKERGMVAIGRPFPGTEAAVLNSNLEPAPVGESGELALAGKQLAEGYFNAPELTAARFPVLRGQRWYLTGDLVYQDAELTLHHLGRIDNQIKVLGNRVELEDVEAHLRGITGTDLAAAVAWPLQGGSASGIVAFHCAPGLSTAQVREGMKKRVPPYMVPSQVHYLQSLPLAGASGKIDRKALVQMLEEGRFSEPA
jgi:amino acid adenylation domain-containing protein